jgi:hypothetical protein
VRLFPRRYVRIRFVGQDRLYCYKCRNAAVGDFVRVKTDPGVVQIVPVIKLGRNLHRGKIKEAVKVS